MLRLLIVAKYTLVKIFIVYSNVSKTFHNFDLSFCIMRKMYINILVLLFFIITFLLTTTATTTLLTIINFYSPKHGICLCASLLSSKPPRDIIVIFRRNDVVKFYPAPTIYSSWTKMFAIRHNKTFL